VGTKSRGGKTEGWRVTKKKRFCGKEGIGVGGGGEKSKGRVKEGRVLAKGKEGIKLWRGGIILNYLPRIMIGVGLNGLK